MKHRFQIQTSSSNNSGDDSNSQSDSSSSEKQCQKLKVKKEDSRDSSIHSNLQNQNIHDPNPINKQEQQIILSSYLEKGSHWGKISRLLQNRSVNQVKNWYYSTIRKSLRRILKFQGRKNVSKKIKKVKSQTLSMLKDILKNEFSDFLSLVKVLFEVGCNSQGEVQNLIKHNKTELKKAFKLIEKANRVTLKTNVSKKMTSNINNPVQKLSQQSLESQDLKPRRKLIVDDEEQAVNQDNSAVKVQQVSSLNDAQSNILLQNQPQIFNQPILNLTQQQVQLHNIEMMRLLSMQGYTHPNEFLMIQYPMMLFNPLLRFGQQL